MRDFFLSNIFSLFFEFFFFLRCEGVYVSFISKKDVTTFLFSLRRVAFIYLDASLPRFFLSVTALFSCGVLRCFFYSKFPCFFFKKKASQHGVQTPSPTKGTQEIVDTNKEKKILWSTL